MQREFQVESLAIGSIIVNDSAVSNLEFHRAGNFLVSTTRESAIHLIDCMTGSERKKLYARTVGVGHVQYTHHEACILFSGVHNSATEIRYMSMHDNVYVRSFKNPDDDVTSLSMSPIDDNFISASDKSINIWSLGSTTPAATLRLPEYSEQVRAVYDGAGVIFAVSCIDGYTKNRSVKLFDARNYDAGPFKDLSPSAELIASALTNANQSATAAKAQAQRILTSSWDSISFSPDGFHLLANASEAVLILDAFKEDSPPVVIPKKNESSGCDLGACISADAKYVFTGTEDNELQIYEKSTGSLKTTLTGHVAPVGCVACNPKYDIFASGCVNTALWIRGDANGSK
jgi:COMPASS component SWD2